MFKSKSIYALNRRLHKLLEEYDTAVEAGEHDVVKVEEDIEALTAKKESMENELIAGRNIAKNIRKNIIGE